MALMNMKAELRRINVTQEQVAESLGMSGNNFGLKTNERIPMTTDEAKYIRDTWLSDFNLDYLLESDGDMPSDRERKLAEVDAVEEFVDASGTRDVFGDAVDEMRAEIG